jgi:signal transduction histidine kinase/ActR/RegA family two-component response regulator
VNAPPAALPTEDALTRRLAKWRIALAAAVGAIALLVTVGFGVERLASARTVETGNALRAATEAQRAAWEAEAAVRAVLLSPAPISPAYIRAEQDSTRARLRVLREIVASKSGQLARLDALDAALTRWDSVFATPVLDGGTLTRALALEGTQAFDEVTSHFDALIAEESRLRVDRIRRQSAVLWTAFILILAALLVAGIAALRITRALEREAAQAAEHQHRIEEQAAELEQQTAILEEQAAQLEENAKALSERVAERDESLRLLRQASTFLDSAVESAPFGIAFYDPGLRFQRINAALAAVNGAPAEAHVGRRIEEMIPELAPTIRPMLERVLATGEAASDVLVEGRTPAAQTPRKWMVTYYPIKRANEPAVGVGCMVLDVTNQHQLEQKLRQAQKLEAVGRLAGGIAHDFNNVLTVIQSYAEVLAFELDERDTAREEVDAIRAAADRATALARQLLAFSRRDVIIPRDIDVNEVIRGMELILRRLLRQGVELRLALGAEPLVVRVDAGQLEQVLMNLAINAVDAMPEGGVLTIQTAAARAADGAAQACIRVEDTGTGMSEEVQERLFEPFFTTKPAGRGTGLGLATTYAIVHEAGGRIDVVSAPNAGSRFDVILPTSGEASAEHQRRRTPEHGVVAAREGEVVLLAEDEPAIRSALTRILEAKKYRVLAAANGGEALRLADTEPGPIHLLLTDVMMPGIGGKDLVRRLRELRPDTRVIMMSGYTDDADLRAELGAAKFTFLQKPFAARQVLTAVREVLDAD